MVQRCCRAGVDAARTPPVLPPVPVADIASRSQHPCPLGGALPDAFPLRKWWEREDTAHAICSAPGDSDCEPAGLWTPGGGIGWEASA